MSIGHHIFENNKYFSNVYVGSQVPERGQRIFNYSIGCWGRLQALREPADSAASLLVMRVLV